MNITKDNTVVVDNSTLVFVCVKPHLIRGALREIKHKVTSSHIIVSIAAGISIESLESVCADVWFYILHFFVTGWTGICLVVGKGRQPQNKFWFILLWLNNLWLFRLYWPWFGDMWFCLIWSSRFVSHLLLYGMFQINCVSVWCGRILIKYGMCSWLNSLVGLVFVFL